MTADGCPVSGRTQADAILSYATPALGCIEDNRKVVDPHPPPLWAPNVLCGSTTRRNEAAQDWKIIRPFCAKVCAGMCREAYAADRHTSCHISTATQWVV